jgi:hypothetical protein
MHTQCVVARRARGGRVGGVGAWCVGGMGQAGGWVLRSALIIVGGGRCWGGGRRAATQISIKVAWSSWQLSV